VPAEEDTTEMTRLIDGILFRYIGLIVDFLQQAHARNQRRYDNLDTVQPTKLVSLTPWLRHTRWNETFQGKDMSTLCSLTLKPTEGEMGLPDVWQSVARIIEKSVAGVKDCFSRRWTMIPFWLASARPHEASTRPFRTHFADGTIERYTSYWQRYICFCLRTIEEGERYGVEFLPAQEVALRELMALVVLDNPGNDEVDAKVMEVSTLLIRHCDYTIQRSSLIYFSGVLGYSTEYKQWLQPNEYTTHLAGIQFCIRVLQLESALPTDSRNDLLVQGRNPMRQ
jgi:hypothetical protein